uniref:Gamma-aminobutyric acid receptor subunit beta n=1 Tax=Wuchereria bancrofti TaxID=6293 RepID=A0AAF5PRK0_WUCBA
MILQQIIRFYYLFVIIFNITDIFFVISRSQLLNFNSSRINVSDSSLIRTSTYYKNASALLADLLNDYDMRLRPGFGGDALLLTLDIIVDSIDAISEVNMDYTITMYLHQYWRDERLSWSHHYHINDIILSEEFSQYIWVPDTFIANDKQSFLHDVTEKNKIIRIEKNGQITYGIRFTTTLACHMNLRNYPLDNQNCTMEIENGYTTSEILMHWNHPNAIFGMEKIIVPQFEILGYQTLNRIARTATGAYQRLSLAFHFKRSAGYFIFQTYLLCIIIVMLSWISFWISHEATSARVALATTTILTMTTIGIGVRQSLPAISYVKSIDIYLVVCFMFVFAALLEYAIINYSYYNRQSKLCENKTKKNKRNKIAKSNVMHYGTIISDKNDNNRSQSPLLSLIPFSRYARKRTNLTIPHYPRFISDNKLWHRKRLKRHENLNMKHRKQMIKIHAQWLHTQTRSIAGSVHVCDVNLIDKNSRIIFPLTFIIFNICYWGYYTIIQ